MCFNFLESSTFWTALSAIGAFVASGVAIQMAGKDRRRNELIKLQNSAEKITEALFVVNYQIENWQTFVTTYSKAISQTGSVVTDKTNATDNIDFLGRSYTASTLVELYFPETRAQWHDVTQVANDLFQHAHQIKFRFEKDERSMVDMPNEMIFFRNKISFLKDALPELSDHLQKIVSQFKRAHSL